MVCKAVTGLNEKFEERKVFCFQNKLWFESRWPVLTFGKCPGCSFKERLSVRFTGVSAERVYCQSYLNSKEARQPYSDGVYMLPTSRERNSDGAVFLSYMVWLHFIDAFSISLALASSWNVSSSLTFLSWRNIIKRITKLIIMATVTQIE